MTCDGQYLHIKTELTYTALFLRPHTHCSLGTGGDSIWQTEYIAITGQPRSIHHGHATDSQMHQVSSAFLCSQTTKWCWWRAVAGKQSCIKLQLPWRACCGGRKNQVCEKHSRTLALYISHLKMMTRGARLVASTNL